GFISMPRARRYSWRQNIKDLVELSEILIRTTDAAELYGQLTQRIAQITGARSCLIAKYDKHSRRFITQKPHYGLREKDGTALEYQITPEFVNLWNFRKNGTLLSNHPVDDPRIYAYFVKNYSVKSVILAPIMLQRDLLGLIAIINKRRGFT
ncbi:MAG TPA: GAF domain-containing protein, partial [Acidobacteriota bacterium]|nr:GAF domain-containing protein [Acidobacteriota bacterium]